MLIIGDLATQQYYPEHEVSAKEIVVYDEIDYKKAKEKFNLPKNFKIRFIKDKVDIYEDEDGMQLRVHKAHKYDNAALRVILNAHLAIDGRCEYAHPCYNYVFELCRVTQRYDDFDVWLGRLEAFVDLQTDFVWPAMETNRFHFNKISKLTELIKPGFLENRKDFTEDTFNYGGHNSQRLEWLDIIQLKEESSLLNLCKDKRNVQFYQKDTWTLMPYHEQLAAVIEHLYLATLEAWVVPALMFFKNWLDAEEVHKGYLESIMQTLSDEQCDFMVPFILGNIENILLSYDVGFYISFKNYLKQDKTWKESPEKIA